MTASTITSSPAAAYRADMEDRREPFGPHDDQWLHAAGVLHQAAHGAPEDAQLCVFEALTIALETLGDAEVERLARHEWGGEGERSKYEPIMLLANSAQEAGALSLAARMLDDLQDCALPFTPVERGRLLALRARVEWKMGRLDDAVDRYRYIESIGVSAREPELVARAAWGLSTIAQIRGNLPEMAAHTEEMARVSEKHGLRMLGRRAYQGLTIIRAQRSQFDDAFVAAWRTLEMSADDFEETEALQNLGQLMVEAGHVALARSCFAALVSRPLLARALLPALGGLAIASARLGAEPTVEWAVREIWLAQQEPVPRYELAQALLEAGEALRTLGRRDEAERYRRAGVQLAEARGFHGLAYVATESASEPATTTPVPLGAEATAIGARVAALEPQRLPERLRFDRVAV